MDSIMEEIICNRHTFGISAENPTGARNGGSKGKDCEKLNACIRLEGGKSAEICNIDGPGVINHIWMGGLNIGHGCILRIYWDGASQPSVEAPLSAFFGSAYDETVLDRDGRYVTLNSALLMVAPDRSCNCYFEMPFRSHCRITVENRSEHPTLLFYMITGWQGEIPQQSGYFHALYRQEHPVCRGRAYEALNTSGRGRFLGITMAAGMNGHSTCWVEGEVKMYIDGETYPSLNYTGTEDYFLGAFAFGNDGPAHRYQPYSGLYAGMYSVLGCDSSAQYNAQQRFLLYRFHVRDAIYFNSGFRMTLDNLGWSGPRYDDYTTVAYYYLDKPSPLPCELPDHASCRMT